MSSHGSSNTGAKQTGGMASATKTPATAGVGDPQPKALDAQGMIGKQFTGKAALPFSACLPPLPSPAPGATGRGNRSLPTARD